MLEFFKNLSELCISLDETKQSDRAAMKALISVLATAVIVGVIADASNGLMAAPIAYDFTGATSGNQALGASHTYTAAGGPDITAISGFYTQLGSGSPVTGDAFTPGGQLVGNNDGGNGMGVGVCFGNGCNHGHIDDNSGIDASGREVVRLDITGLISSFSSLTIDADSVSAGGLLGIFASDATGTTLGAKLGDATSSGDVSISPTSNFLFFVADNSTTSGAEVLLHSLTATSNDIPEPAGLALLGTAILTFGLIHRKRRQRGGMAAPMLA
jgi:hypothetical protein